MFTGFHREKSLTITQKAPLFTLSKTHYVQSRNFIENEPPLLLLATEFLEVTAIKNLDCAVIVGGMTEMQEKKSLIHPKSISSATRKSKNYYILFIDMINILLCKMQQLKIQFFELRSLTETLPLFKIYSR